jgi:hypothetical protein
MLKTKLFCIFALFYLPYETALGIKMKNTLGIKEYMGL